MSIIQLRKRKRNDYSFHLEYQTRWSDNDQYFHLNNSVYNNLFDAIINTYLIQHCGLEPSKSPCIGLVVHAECNYFGSVAFPAIVDLGLRVSKLGKSSVTYEVGVFEQGHEDARAVGGYTHVFVDRDNQRPPGNGIPGEIRNGLQKLVRFENSKL